MGWGLVLITPTGGGVVNSCPLKVGEIERNLLHTSVVYLVFIQHKKPQNSMQPKGYFFELIHIGISFKYLEMRLFEVI